MNTKTFGSALLAVCFGSAAAVAAPPFDGFSPIECETQEVHDCVPGGACARQTPEQASVAKILRIDPVKRTIDSAYRKEPLKILVMDVTEDRMALQGHEQWVVWSAVLRQKDSSVAVTVADRKGAFALFGKCKVVKAGAKAATGSSPRPAARLASAESAPNPTAP
jgi:hypothetical protein